MEEERKTSKSKNLFGMSKIEFKTKKVLTINSNQHQKKPSIDSVLRSDCDFNTKTLPIKSVLRLDLKMSEMSEIQHQKLGFEDDRQPNN